jgi:hypothetical protein
MNTLRRALPALATVAVATLAGCKATVRHQIDPIHITLDVNLKVDKELDEFFAFERDIEQEVLESMPEGADLDEEASS